MPKYYEIARLNIDHSLYYYRMEFTEVIASTLSCYSPCGNWIASWEDGRMLTVYDAFSLEAKYRITLPPFKRGRLHAMANRSRYFKRHFEYSCTRSLKEASCRNHRAHRNHECVHILLMDCCSIGCFLWMQTCTTWRVLKQDLLEMLDVLVLLGEDLLVLLTDGNITCFDKELKTIKSTPLNCQTFQVSNDTIYGYDSLHSDWWSATLDHLQSKACHPRWTVA